MQIRWCGRNRRTPLFDGGVQASSSHIHIIDWYRKIQMFGEERQPISNCQRRASSPLRFATSIFTSGLGIAPPYSGEKDSDNARISR